MDEAMKIAHNDVASELDSLPPQKMHCSNLAVDAFRETIKGYKREKDAIDRAVKRKVGIPNK